MYYRSITKKLCRKASIVNIAVFRSNPHHSFIVKHGRVMYYRALRKKMCILVPQITTEQWRLKHTCVS